ncbi:MAG TPA: DUF2505 family protein [Acidimicrobiales bacterium]|nr:DUF2505 family protein [Acidimicrobiales bacterium]
MRFSFDQVVEVVPERAVSAYADPRFYEGRPARDHIEVVEVLSHRPAGDGRGVDIEVRFRFTGPVSSAVRAVIDPSKISWVTRTAVHPEDLRTEWEVLPDHYPDRLIGRGTFTFAPAGPASTAVKVDGDLKVRVPIVGRSVERVIVQGLRSYIENEVRTIPDVPWM